MTRAKLPPLRELRFGELDASEEAIVSPLLLELGYFDFRSAAYSIASRATWILLGPKGAGKSAVLEHLRLKWAGRTDKFMTYWELDTFPVLDVTKINLGLGGSGQRGQSAWEFLLLLRVYESILRDDDRISDKEFLTVAHQLRAKGFLDVELSTLVTGLARSSTGIDLKFVSANAEWGHGEPALPEPGVALRSGLSTLRLTNQHLIALDGLDTFFFEGGAGSESLSGLIDGLASVNRFLMEMNLPVSIAVTLRSDHFDALNSQNSNKLKSHTVYLDWTDGGIGSQNHLWSIITQKAAAMRPEVTDVVGQYLSLPMYSPAFPNIATFLLDYTRLLPRDAVAMMTYIQQCHPGSTPVTEPHAKEAATRYSSEYFVGETMNNLSGVLQGTEAHKLTYFRDALRAAPSRYFNMSYLNEELEGELSQSQIRGLLRRMFETGSLGISNPRSNGYRYTDFIFRRVSGAAFTTRYDFILHNALTRAWNRPWRD